ncbi:MAG: TetR/AcrR family transcriptional regulator [Chthoniobacteraceae bacterium]|nr:TetR/AcrR family transcriptional regulator [Chthoniobacteraceae bacterium]
MPTAASIETPSRRPPGTHPVEERILAAARAHFFVHGFRGVTMSDLAADLGMSKKTLYAHFPSKTALVERVLSAKLRAVEEELQRITGESPADFTATLRQMLACIQRHTQQVRPPFLRDIERETPELHAFLKKRRQELAHRSFGKLIAAGRKAGIIRRDIPANLVIEMLLGIQPEKMAELGLTPAAALTMVTSVLFEGLLTEKGRARP